MSPGAKGSEDFSQVAATPDFMALARGAVRDVTGQDGEHFGPVNSYDQSFYNIGVSSCFIWCSMLEVIYGAVSRELHHDFIMKGK